MGESRIDVLCCDTNELQLPRSRIESTLSKDELARAERFRFPELAHRYRVGRYLLRDLIAARTGISARDIRFSVGKKGKPYLPGGPAFNMSDSRSIVLIGIAAEGNLGIDIEHIQPSGDLNHLAERYFSLDERASLRGLQEPERTRAFFRAWTRKEALVKAVGGGLSIPLDAFSVSIDKNPANALLSGDGEAVRGTWYVRSLSIAADCEAAVAWDRQPSAIEPCFWRSQT